ncbi:3,4-dihydroxy-2-butanone-4-phosphate synthase [Candidatus Gracilibacteria bacterium]|nr:3,4-dihydroxy-2-butanone-4-phosphate synthase [Candidatus Gracilibacteria bacterium]
MNFDPLNKVLEEFAKGEFIMVLDEHREKEGDFFLLAEHVTPEKINFLLSQARGMICVACDKSIIDKFKLPLMVEENSDKFGTNFCVSVDAKNEITTGVSAFDRAKTISILADPKATILDLVKPGHTFPLLAKDKNRFGHTEAATFLAKKLNRIPVVVICEILNSSGEKASTTELFSLSKEKNCPITNLESIKSVLENE